MTDELEGSPRVTGSVLGAVECRLLIRLAGAMPAGVSPNMLTVVGLAGAALSSAAYCLCNWNIHFLWLASAGLVLNWFGDSLDGTLARVRRKERKRYGFAVDHTVDLAAQLLIGFGLGISPFVRFDIACIALIVYLSFVAFAFIKTVTSGELQISYAGVGPTEVRCALIAINLVLIWYQPQKVAMLWAPMSAIDLAVLTVSILAAFVLAVGALVEIRRLAAEDP
jgi:phosphatidylglycerophosphate synthase